ncbi:aminotransferase class IV family protein [Roseovarius nubinhibens]|uniref:aminotransferase class IV family protein n=1 Tax=Roseovarius nubinhibens TaxID=314263 RepID=UPI0030EBAE94
MESPLCPPDDPGFRLIETLRWEPGQGAREAARHLARLARSAQAFGIEVHGAAEALAGVVGDAPLRLRLTVDAAGRAEVTSAPYVPVPEGTVWRVGLAETRLASDDPWLQHKTTRRALYDQARADLPGWIDEMLFCNEAGAVCEGTITNLFVPRDGVLLTPPQAEGLLPGILRERLIEEGRAREARIMPEDLSEEFFVGNDLRGLIKARLV